jgi:hypothetical protein
MVGFRRAWGPVHDLVAIGPVTGCRFLLLLLLSLAAAHTDTPGVLLLDVGRYDVEVELRVPADMLRAAIARDRDDMSRPPPADDVVFDYVLEHLSLTAGGADLTLTGDAVSWFDLGGKPLVRVELQGHSDRAIGDLTLDSAVINERYPPYQTSVILRSDVANPQYTQALVGWTTGGDTDVTIPVAGSHDPGAVALETAADGFQHVLSGADHLIFLLELLLVVPLTGVGGRWLATSNVPWKRLLGLLSMFTVAHSVTLIAATVGWIPAPGRWVEVGVALTVLLAAAHLVRPLWPGKEGWFVAFAGLVHGTAFAEDLVGSGLEGWHLAVPLVAFNIGIELGQLTVAALAIPLWWATRHAEGVRWGGAAIALVAATGWLVERLFGVENPLSMDAWITTPWLLWPLLWGLGAWAWWRRR